MKIPDTRDPALPQDGKKFTSTERGQVKKADDMNVVERLCAPTPKFFKKLRTIGLILAAVGGTLLAAPVALPAAVITAGGYILVAGTVASAVSQAAVEECGNKKKSNNN